MQRGYACIMMSRSCSVCGKDGTGMTTKAGGFQTCVPRQDVQKWSTFVATTCIQGSPEKPAFYSPKKTLRLANFSEFMNTYRTGAERN